MRRLNALALLTGLLIFLACSAPKNIFVLIPDAEDGRVGEILISNEAGEQVITTPGTAVSVSDAQTAPDKPKPIDSEGIKSIFKDALSAVPQPPAQFELQFKTGTSSLTETSQKLLSKIILAIIERQPCDISIVGHTDTQGSAQENIALGLNRANAVKQILIDQGVADGQIEVSSHGEASPVIPTADGMDEPRNRRVEVLIR